MNKDKFVLSLSAYNLIKRDDRFSEGYTNCGMETPNSPEGGDFNSSCFNSLTPGMDSDFDESLAVPESLSVISVSDKLVSQDTFNIEEVDHPVLLDTALPFNTIHKTPIKFKSTQRKVFIPGMEIKVRFIENERSATTHLLNPNLYTISLQHGEYSWTIKKRYKHILYLHQQLRLYRTSLNIPFPTKTHRDKRASFKNTLNAETAEIIALDSARPRPIIAKRKEARPKKRKGALPRFPSKPEVMIPYDGIQLRMKLLEDYLYNLLNISIYRNHHETVNFLEVSHMSFIEELGLKGKEGMIEKRTGSTQPGQAGCNCFGLFHCMVCVRCNYFCTGLVCAKWQKRWLFVKDTYFGYIRPRDGVIKNVMLFDQGFEISTGMYSTGLSNGLQILNMSRQMVIKCWTRRKSREWMQHFKEVANHAARDFTFPNVHHSFAPVRAGSSVWPLVDGSTYLSAAADAMEAAREEIFIADWWLSPEIYMKRPAIHGDYWRLDQILRRKAAQGVKVFVLLFKEVEMALGINSFYSKQKLIGENIKVFRHPDHAKAGVLLWAHHEKIVCVDQTVAFLGGIDLCYGRWDDSKHRLTDLGSVTGSATGSLNSSSIKSRKKTSSSPGRGEAFVPPPADPDTPVTAALANIAIHSKDVIVGTAGFNRDVQTTLDSQEMDGNTRSSIPTLEPGDKLLMPKPSVQFDDKTQSASSDMGKRNVLDKITDRGKDFISLIYPQEHEESAFDETERRKAERYAASTEQMILTDAEGDGGPKSSSGIKKPFSAPLANIVEGRIMTEREQHQSKSVQGTHKLWLGKDYTNFIVKDFHNLDLPFVDLVDRNTTPRMPWHDIGLAVEGPAARDVARHFIQRWNAVKLEKARANPSYPYLMPKSYKDFKTRRDLTPEGERYTVSCQVLRSVCSWSCGFLEQDTVEQSIHEAYVDTITRAQHYIYIENQFFITLSMSNMYVRNQIGEALYNRILRAYKAKEVFRVFVVMPLLPGFEGEVGAPSGTSLHAVTHWNYQSISRSKEALLTRLYEAGIPDPSQYISFHGLRTHSMLDGEPVTELVYVHSKLLISDDRTVICGSANINDRSMLGKRDSEIAVIIQDELFDEGSMNGAVFPSGRYAGGLRKRLFREHLGILDLDIAEHGIDVSDPCISTFYTDIWLATSKRNTLLYEDVFHCIPTDQVISFSALKKYQEEYQNTLWHTDPIAANAKIADIKGYLVDLPLNFLVNEVLTPKTTSMEGMMPTALWT